MSNQYTTGRGDKPRFTVVLTPEQAEQFDYLAGLLQRDRSAIFRQCLEFMHQRARQFEQKYPALESYSLQPILAAYYDAGRYRMEQELVKEQERFEAYCDARQRQSGLDYQPDPRTVRYYWRIWQQGKTEEEMLTETAELKARIAQQYDLRPEDLNEPDNGLPLDDQPPERTARQSELAWREHMGKHDPETPTDYEARYQFSFREQAILAMLAFAVLGVLTGLGWLVWRLLS